MKITDEIEKKVKNSVIEIDTLLSFHMSGWTKDRVEKIIYKLIKDL